ncbi:MAG: TIGR03546 family protein [Planctomycetes bacterium]|nr:TIGR03546 family protein [Planctomycetota bacterium]
MFFLLNQLRKLLKAFNKDATPAQIAGGFMLGSILGLIPKFNLFGFILMALILLIRVNISMSIVGMALFSALGFFTDLLIEGLGYGILNLGFLHGLWTFLYNLPIVPWTAFNNSMVMGNLIFGLILAFPVYKGMSWFVVYYRNNVKDKIMKWKFMQVLMASKVYQWYEKVAG